MQLLLYLFYALQILIALYLLQPFVILVLHYLQKWISPYRSPVERTPLVIKNFDFAAIITAHADTRFIPPLVDSLLKQSYKGLHVYVVADDCDVSGLNINDQRVTLLVPQKPFHAKIKSIQHAVSSFVRQHDALVIFDSDNLAHPDYFDVLNKYFQQGYKAVQTQMLSKNTDTIYAKLDSIGHIYYTFMDRQSRMELGLSAHTLGLGIAIDCGLYNEIMYRDNLGGFDKKMQAELVKRVPQLAFAAEAMVYDEKVDDGQTLEKQRTRWMFTYFHYFDTHFNLLLTGLKQFNFNRIFFGFAVLRPPLVIMLGMALLFLLINMLVHPALSLAWLVLFVLYCISFVAIILTQSLQKGMSQALVYLPLFALRQLKALLRIKQAGKSFLKTEHNNVLYIEDVLR